MQGTSGEENKAIGGEENEEARRQAEAQLATVTDDSKGLGTKCARSGTERATLETKV